MELLYNFLNNKIAIWGTQKKLEFYYPPKFGSNPSPKVGKKIPG
jgi:hypothetical protein